jgi:hypothetical protein
MYLIISPNKVKIGQIFALNFFIPNGELKFTELPRNFPIIKDNRL